MVRATWLALVVISTSALAAEPEREVAKELGSVLAWRLGPAAVEEKCRDMDPAGAEARKTALETWQRKNSRLIESVDSRVAELMPLIDTQSPREDAVRKVHGQVTAILLEGLTVDACKSLADPAATLWTHNRLTHVQQSLAALYDWQVTHTPK